MEDVPPIIDPINETFTGEEKDNGITKEVRIILIDCVKHKQHCNFQQNGKFEFKTPITTKDFIKYVKERDAAAIKYKNMQRRMKHKRKKLITKPLKVNDFVKLTSKAEINKIFSKPKKTNVAQQDPQFKIDKRIMSSVRVTPSMIAIEYSKTKLSEPKPN